MHDARQLSQGSVPATRLLQPAASQWAKAGCFAQYAVADSGRETLHMLHLMMQRFAIRARFKA
jgi:hypothetical protein